MTETPLEVIEQRFLPPDITIDMYETECDNEDWRDFIQGIVQPMGKLTNVAQLNILERRELIQVTIR